MRVAPGIGFSKSMSDQDATGFIGGTLLGRFIARLCSTWFGFFFILPLLLPFILLLLVVPAAIRLIRLLIFGSASLFQQSPPTILHPLQHAGLYEVRRLVARQGLPELRYRVVPVRAEIEIVRHGRGGLGQHGGIMHA